MSYDIFLNDPVSKDPIGIGFPHRIRGGTYQVGGATTLELNITYNYAPIFYRSDVFGEGGIRSLYGKTALESIPILERAIAALNDDIDPDYWKATDGNAKRALIQLLAFAKMRPDGIWDGD